jgi:DNA repair ATPase RecN
MDRAEELIGCLEEEIRKRDARINTLKECMQMDAKTIRAKDVRIAELEREARNDDVAYRAVLERQNELRAELAALRAQEPASTEFKQFMTSVVTAAGLLSCGKQSKGLAADISASAYKYLLAAPVVSADCGSEPEVKS